jgi:hypothetical protein
MSQIGERGIRYLTASVAEELLAPLACEPLLRVA